MKQDAAMHSVTSLNTSSEEGSTPPISFGPDAEEAEELVIYAFIYLFIFLLGWNSMRGGESATPDSMMKYVYFVNEDK